MVWTCCEAVCNADRTSESPSESFRGVTRYEAVRTPTDKDKESTQGASGQTEGAGDPRFPFAIVTVNPMNESAQDLPSQEKVKHTISASMSTEAVGTGPLGTGQLTENTSAQSLLRNGVPPQLGSLEGCGSGSPDSPVSPRSDLLMSGASQDVPVHVSHIPETTPEKFMDFWSSARYHRAVDEQELGPSIVVPPGTGPEVETCLEFSNHLSQVFEAIRQEIPEPIDEQRAAVTETPSGANIGVSLTLRRTPTRLNTPIADPQWFKSQGFEDVSPPQRGKNGEIHAWLKIEPKRTYCSMDLRDLPFSVEELLPVICEFEQFPVWFPFLQSAEVLHDFPGTNEHIRMGRGCLKLPVVSLESITIVCIEDRLRDCGCIGVYVFSPPEDIMMSKEGGEWMGAQVPGVPKSNFQVRLPFAWARTCIFPVSRTRTRIRAEAAVVNVVPPIHWVFRYSTREMAKRVPSMLSKMVRESKTNAIGKAAAQRADFYRLWGSRLEAHYTRLNM
mmetsp:Transcript_59753/g.142172  ORF Transcript_59753/g.142172 Transcript_59753/m.142172 type:complete len:502 (-) Transcript_59753:58-1563(-)